MADEQEVQPNNHDLTQYGRLLLTAAGALIGLGLAYCHYRGVVPDASWYVPYVAGFIGASFGCFSIDIFRHIYNEEINIDNSLDK